MRVYEVEGGETDDDVELARFSVLYAKPSTRKHKKWEGDGVLICYAKIALLKSEDEKDIIGRSTSVKRIEDLDDGKVILLGGWEVQIQERIDTGNNREVISSHTKVVRQPPTFQPVKRSLLSENVDAPVPKKVASNRGFVCPLNMSENVEQVPPMILNQMAVNEGKEKPILVDPMMSRFLRPHQKEGVQFIYNQIKNTGGGAILADEMGLGKSLQTITATWALLKKQPGVVTGISKCLLVVPSSLVNNWKCEFRKWFRGLRSPAIIVQTVADIRSYINSINYSPYLLISYDMALRHEALLSTYKFDVLVCDEAHRLKNITSKLRQALSSLGITRRLLLTGTPVQNDLDEFYSLLDFARPGLFGTLPEFRAMTSGENQSSSLNDLLAEVMLRRSAQINNEHLPIKHEIVLFCQPSSLQRRVATAICDHMTGDSLVLIDMMRKLANHPAILYKRLTEMQQQTEGSIYSNLLQSYPNSYGSQPAKLTDSGKLSVLIELLGSFRQLGECTVVVSNYTKTLDMISALCGSIGLHILRLDGSTPVASRQKLVEKFNSERDPRNVFLLSTKAGGVGLNLIGASRLIMFDSDWNPASDLQAMARIWRDGQTKPCFIYRLITTGGIDEKILQRQIKKTGLCAVLDASELAGQENVKFNDDDLLDIFSPTEGECNTHDMMGCCCGGSGMLPDEMEADAVSEMGENDEVEERQEEEEPEGEIAVDDAEATERNETTSMAELFRWRHYSPSVAASWSLFIEQSSIPSSASDITFAMHLSTHY